MYPPYDYDHVGYLGPSYLETMSESAKAKTVISDEQRGVLEEWYSNGMRRRAVETKEMRNKAASATGLSLEVIDNWIANRNRLERKRSGDESSDRPTKTPKLTLRGPNPYNMFSSEYFQSEAARSFSFADHNKEAGKKWRELPADQREKYVEAAKKRKEDEHIPTSKDKSTIEKLLQVLQKNANMAEKMKCDLVFLGFYDGRVYEGGSVASLKFLDKHGVFKEAFGAHFCEELLKQNLKNKTLMSSTKGDLSTKEDIASMSASTEEGSSEDKTSTTTAGNLYTTGSMSSSAKGGTSGNKPVESEENLIIAESSSKSTKESVKKCASSSGGKGDSGNQSKKNGSNNSKEKGKRSKSKRKPKNKKGQEKDDGSGRAENQNGDASFSVGMAVQLLDKTRKVVGNGRIASQSSSHGKDIPFGYMNVEVAIIASNVKPFISSPFDDDFLCVGQFTPWPTKQLQTSIRSPVNTRNKN